MYFSLQKLSLSLLPESCQLGQYYDLTTAQCTGCPRGFYANNSGSFYCSACDFLEDTPGTSTTTNLACSGEYSDQLTGHSFLFFFYFIFLFIPFFFQMFRYYCCMLLTLFSFRAKLGTPSSYFCMRRILETSKIALNFSSKIR